MEKIAASLQLLDCGEVSCSIHIGRRRRGRVCPRLMTLSLPLLLPLPYSSSSLLSSSASAAAFPRFEVSNSSSLRGMAVRMFVSGCLALPGFYPRDRHFSVGRRSQQCDHPTSRH
ncbi:uncharacterized protein K489DRAFT_53101 [Dissoconium aciculare CBS 342.82]|uniref:Uncharacterized protein n=1 Tax=Dissoconium aciculare CBS 342.82 TaxID=1314786 RepID=A0A6J3LYD0_9PEZI|nr:uncharacterized protein K489DRAFT_53101 [Dissoconium aciculare CBS 342.82]KAF1820314.1 hypothetical protein K489DRAFT_53101 [Dissoconium aciculare CBS 342.82]